MIRNKIRKRKNITVCLLSGGMDSCVAATLAKRAGDELYLLSFNWGQAFVQELENAKKISGVLQPKEHRFLEFKDYNRLSLSALTAHHKIPTKSDMSKDRKKIPVSYPPGRDPTFIMIGLSWLESIMLDCISRGEEVSSGKVIIGTNKEDSLVYPDCQPEVYGLLNQMLRISTKVGKEHKIPIEIRTPLIDMTKKEVLEKGLEIGAPVQHTYSCFGGRKLLCGKCHTCRLVYFAFKDLGAKNPFRYNSTPERKYS